MTSTLTAPEAPPGAAPSQRPYTAVGTAAELWRNRAPELVVSGPAGTGKSRACLEKLHFCALKYARMRGLIIRKTRESLTESALVTFEEKVVPEQSPLLVDGPRRNFRQVYRYPNGSQIVVGGLDKPGKVMSTEYDMIYVQEATELELVDWLALTTRLRNGVMTYQQLLADCNPDAPTHWLWLRAQAGHVTLLHSRHEDNPRLYQRGQWTEEGLRYLATLDRLGVLNPETNVREGTEYQRLRLGQWVQASGLVYDTYRDDANVSEAAAYAPDGGELLWALDDGYSGQLDPQTGLYTADSHPRVILLAQLRPTGQLCVFAEHYATKMLEEQQITAALALPYPAPDWAVCDSSAAQLRSRLRESGIPTRRGTHPVAEGIKLVRSWLPADEHGVHRILIHPRCKQLRAELMSYRYDAQGAPIKQFDHGPDALRYLCWKLRYVEDA